MICGKLEKHHKIGFDTIEKIDWHLKNLWLDGWQTIEETYTNLHDVKEAKNSSKRNKTDWYSRYTKKLKGEQHRQCVIDLKNERK